MQRCVIAMIVTSICQRACAEVNLIQRSSQWLSESTTRRRKPYYPQATADVAQCTAGCIPNCCQACPSLKRKELNGSSMTVEIDLKDCKQEGTLSWVAAKTHRGFEGFVQNVDVNETITFTVPADKFFHLQVSDDSFFVQGDYEMCDSGTRGYGQDHYWAGDCMGGCGKESQSSACDVYIYMDFARTTTTTTTTTTTAPKTHTTTAIKTHTTTTTTSCETKSCEIYSDPHVIGFDSDAEGPASLGHLPFLLSLGSTHPVYYGAGDVWLVKSDSVHIQGRFVSSTAFKTGGTVMGAMAIGGPLLDGKVLLVEPRGGSVSLNGHTMSFGVYGSEVSSGNLRIVNDEKEYSRHRPFNRVEVHLPMNMEVTVNRYDDFLNVRITMPAEGTGVIDGQCGNMNGHPEDDTITEIERRMSSTHVLPHDSLFVNE